MNLTGKSAIVFGGAGGIGSELCRGLLRQDVQNLAIVDVLDADLSATVVKQLSDEFDGKRIVYLRANIAKLPELELAFKQAVDKIGGKLNVVINAAGLFNDKDVNETLTVNAVSERIQVLKNRKKVVLTMWYIGWQWSRAEQSMQRFWR